MSKILLIDDEFDFSDLTKTMLEFHDFDVSSLNDPIQVVEHIKNEKYDLIVTDLMMPNIDGFEVIRRVRELDDYKDVPLFVLSAKVLNDEERKFLLQNNVHFLVKPFEPHGLVEQIQNLLGDA